MVLGSLNGVCLGFSFFLNQTFGTPSSKRERIPEFPPTDYKTENSTTASPPVTMQK